MDAILNCKQEELEDYYALLGCDELSTVEQILAEFKVLALECHPDKHLGNPKAVENFQRLQQAKEILTNAESRARYDHWQRSRILIPFQQWEALNNSVKTSMHWAVKSKKEPMLEAPDVNSADPITNKIEAQQGENKVGFSTERRVQEETKILGRNADEEELVSPKSPSTPSDYETNYWHLRFRWSAESPSELLRKFRNYEI
ncbi:dnaJ homolog subfamily C member 12 isoform X2 [Rhinatrema bivittatum]|uniref:dnaJ homolog subfamily C member 12 isoform X2 n=1 Tax=Rhinatrema bivittatum TaxID=194408 RepID=UPI00112C80BD|nr:dnaJ homolog subfamily C member 12 isoform X2 [Rhinatrema bivittatum]